MSGEIRRRVLGGISFRSLLALAVLCVPALAAEYVVTPSGADTNDGTRQAPFQSVGRGLAALKPGDTLIIGPGVYRESSSLTVKGTKEQPVAIVGVAVTVQKCPKCGTQSRPAAGGQGETPEADKCPKCGAQTQSDVAEPCIQAAGPDGLRVTDSTYVTVMGLKITGAKEAGVVISRCDRVTIEGCAIADNAKWGVRVSLSDHIKVGKCEISGTSDGDGVYVSATEHPEVSDCKILKNAFCGVLVSGNAKEGGDGVVTGATVSRNIISENGSKGGAAIRLEGVEKSTIENNMCDKNLSSGIECVKGEAARAGSRNVLSGNVVRFLPGKGTCGMLFADGGTHIRLVQSMLTVGNGPAISVDEASAKDFKSSYNFFPLEAGPVRLSWKGESMDFPRWQQVTGQDADSHVGSPASVPAPSAAEPPGKTN